MKPTFRECEPGSDRDQLRCCIVELQEFERTLEPALPAAMEMADVYIDLLLKRCTGTSGRILVVEIGQTIVGLVAVLARVLPEDPDEEQTPYAYVSDLVVLPDYRGRGVGHALLEQAESYARSAGATILRINVLAKNEDAARLYENFGFTDYRVQLIKRLP